MRNLPRAGTPEMKKRLQNKIAESRMALPATLAYAAVVCLATGLMERHLWLPAGSLVLTTLLMAQLNSANALIRIYSRMVSCSYAMLATAAFALSPSAGGNLVAPCMVATYLILFTTYQDRKATGRIFYAFLLLGIASTQFVQILFFVPLLWLLMATILLSLSWRSFWASMLGLAFPYWLVGGYYAYTGQVEALPEHFLQLADLGGFLDYGRLTAGQIATAAFTTLLGLTGIIHFLRNSFLDKIRTRMLFEFFIAMEVFTALALALYPRHYDFLFGILAINTAPLIGHFIALTRTRITHIAFCLLTATVVAITLCNLFGIWNFSLMP